MSDHFVWGGHLLFLLWPRMFIQHEHGVCEGIKFGNTESILKNHKNHKKEQKQEKEKIVLYKLLYTMLILLLYLVGRKIPLYGIDTTAYVDMSQDAQSLLMQMIGLIKMLLKFYMKKQKTKKLIWCLFFFFL